MFQGSKNVPGEYFSLIEKIGANLREGGVNGTTNTDRTNYFATVPSGNLETLLWLESDRLATLLDATDQKKLDNQRDVVKNERRQGLENQPYGRALRDHLDEPLLRPGHPYSWTVIGSMEDLTAASLDDVKAFFRTLLHAEQPVARDRRRLRSGRGEAAGREVLRRPAGRDRRWIGRGAGSRSSTASGSSRSATACRRSGPTSASPAPEYFGADDAALRSPRASSPTACRRGSTRRWSTTSRSRSEVNVGFDAAGDRRRLRHHRRLRATASRSRRSRQVDHARRCTLLAQDRPDARPSSIAPARSRSSSSSPGSSASAASAARPIC